MSWPAISNWEYQDSWYSIAWPSKVESVGTPSKKHNNYQELYTNLATPLLKTILNSLFILRYGSF